MVHREGSLISQLRAKAIVIKVRKVHKEEAVLVVGKCSQQNLKDKWRVNLSSIWKG